MADNTDHSSEIITEFINIQTDFGFKYVFGNLKNKNALIKFLNTLFEGKLIVKDVTYHDKERLPADKNGKRIVYDVYCTTPISRVGSIYFPDYQIEKSKGEIETDHHFILEMQNVYTPPFEERITYYACKMVADQGKAGWDYTLDPVFAIVVTNFNLDHMESKLVRDVMLVDRETGEALTDKIHIMLCSLKELPKEWKDCRTEMEKVLFIIKNIEDMDSSSLAYKEGKYSEIFEAARSNKLRPDQIVNYSESLEKLRDTERGIKYQIERERKKALAEGRAEERAEGIRFMLSLGIDPAIIAKKYEMTIEEINKLSNSSPDMSII